MFDDIIKKTPEICKEIDFSKGFEIWGQKTLKKTNPLYKEVILCRDKTEQGQMVMGQQQEEV